MKIYRKLIPRIARDVVRILLTEHAIELEEGHRDEAELDVAAVMVEYLNQTERLVEDAREMMQRRGLSASRFPHVKKALAEQRNLRIGDDALDHILEQVVEVLFHSKNFEEVYCEDHEIKRLVRSVIAKYDSVDESLDREVRARLRNLREGTAEWDVAYPKQIEELRRIKGLV